MSSSGQHSGNRGHLLPGTAGWRADAAVVPAIRPASSSTPRGHPIRSGKSLQLFPHGLRRQTRRPMSLSRHLCRRDHHAARSATVNSPLPAESPFSETFPSSSTGTGILFFVAGAVVKFTGRGPTGDLWKRRSGGFSATTAEAVGACRRFRNDVSTSFFSAEAILPFATIKER